MVKLNGKKINTAVFISGRGSNLKSLINFSQKINSPIAIKLVISNKPKAKGLIYAKRSKIKIFLTNFKNKKISEKKILKELDKYKINIISLAGFMKILSKNFIIKFKKPILNIHPSLLPKYQGLNTHQRALDAGDDIHGVTVHFVTEELDGGPNAIQAIVPILDVDNAQNLQQRVHAQEHIIYPIAVKWFCEGRLTMKGNEALLDNKVLPATGIQLQS